MRASSLVLLLFAPLQSALPAQSPPCPDERASAVHARTEGSEEGQRCGFQITLFGVVIGVGVVRCPLLQTVYPAHGECRGEAQEGFLCARGDDLEVRLLQCRCAAGEGSSWLRSVPRCACEDLGTAGTVEDFKTTACVTTGGDAR